MDSHDSFGHLKHKLWPKERSRVKLTIWLPTTKSWESTQFPYMQVTCDISLKSSRQRLQLFFKLHPDRRFTHKVIAPRKVVGVPTLGISGFPGQKTIWMWASWRGVEYTIRGKVLASPKSGPWWVLWVQIYPCLILTSKVHP
jgi:hypothetical protein